MKYYCKICNYTSNSSNVVRHIKTKHNISSEEYYQKYNKQTDHLCPICNKPTPFINIFKGYREFCSKTCSGIGTINRSKNTCLLRYGTPHAFQNKEIQKKQKNTMVKKYGIDCLLKTKNFHLKHKVARIQTCLNRFGVDNPAKSNIVKEHARKTCIKRFNANSALQCPYILEKIRNTNSKRFGVYNPFKSDAIRQQIKDTWCKKYGVDNPFKSTEIKERIKEAMVSLYGVENGSQNTEIHNKQQKSSFRSKTYILPSGATINIRGYEPQFLDYIFTNHILKENEIVYSPKGIKYTDNGILRYYFPDFYIPKWNLIVEIKSTWTLLLDKRIQLKERACLDNGLKYIRIVGTAKGLDYTHFNDFIQL